MIFTTQHNPPVFIDQHSFYNNLNGSQKPLKVFQDTLKSGAEKLNNNFEQGENVTSLLHQRSQMMDFLLQAVWKHTQLDQYQSVCLNAVGGYGRAELHPFSDIDILILVESEQLGLQSKINDFIIMLWDMGLKVGHSYRTISQCLALAEQDITVMTNLLELRVIAGNTAINKAMWQQLEAAALWSGGDFFNAKYNEQIRRHKRFGDIEYELEPNVKESPGGLRDCQTIAWVISRLHSSDSLDSLYQQGYCTEDELNSLIIGREFLWRVRYALHLYAAREQDKLTFEYQKIIAQAFNFKDNNKKLAVEQFMQHYYRTVMMLRALNEVIMLQLVDQTANKQRKRQPAAVIIDDDFQTDGDQLELRHADGFAVNPSALLAIFVVFASNPQISSMSAKTIRGLREYGYLIDDEFRNNDQHKALFKKLLSCQYQLATTLRLMSRYGILGRYIPDFGLIIGQSQFDLFHAYPVDVHSLKLVANICQFGVVKLSADFPIASHIFRNYSRPELLLLAGLFHDIAKGRGGDHSELGAVVIADFAKAHGYSDSDVELLSWLVANHLLLTRVAQREDISAADVIENFADIMQTQQRLDLLYVLTVADIVATNPNLWNQYRSSLLYQLYMNCRIELRYREAGDGIQPSRIGSDLIAETKASVIQQLPAEVLNDSLCRAILDNIEDEYFLRQKLDVMIWQLSSIAENHSVDNTTFSVLKPFISPHQDESHVFILTPISKDFTFVPLVSATEHLGINILESQIYRIEAAGYKLSCFTILDGNMQAFDDYQAINQRLVTTIDNNLQLDIKQLLNRDYYVSGRLKQFKLPTQVRVKLSANGAAIEVVAADRPGLLAIIARALVSLGLQLNNAKITTLGERVEDVFWVSNRAASEPIDESRIEVIIDTIKRQVDRQVQEQ